MNAAGAAVTLEEKILGLCARAELHPEQVEELRRLSSASPDWKGLFDLADSHGLFPLLVMHLNGKAADLMPPDALALYRFYFKHNTECMLALTADLIRMVTLLRSHSIVAVPYKGPALASRLYGSVALRQVGDLDIVVSPREVEAAERVLQEVGCQPRYPRSSRARQFLLRRVYNDTLYREGRPIVELHWGFAPAALGFGLSLDQLRPRLEERVVGGTPLLDFASEDLLIVLCVHGSKDAWHRLEWLTGLSELLRRERISWPTVMNRASDLSAERMLLLGVYLAHDRLGAAVPSAIVDLARSDRAVMRLTSKVEKRLLQAEANGDGAGLLQRDLFRLQLQSSHKDRLRYVYYRVTTPRKRDIHRVMPIPRHRLPLSSLTRPIRTIGKAAGSLFSSRVG